MSSNKLPEIDFQSLLSDIQLETRESVDLNIDYYNSCHDKLLAGNVRSDDFDGFMRDIEMQVYGRETDGGKA